ncbi:branched-chain amino acid aminotransferase [Chitinophaga terrae (ex Kim and Jung 2007)]|uniref:branched-chain-amino-acid transaminase n=1 Tax=Chitinophaga terrae (ex Kim and Jung 2007) TaxID=408074 RepID=A0A1H4DL89_9BACT|nr:aminotransferase class IV [Chitinophaga terrae (ex Kim and Jung 2007)]MDQ0107795.1 branched-chain amino acid aminotransferase [Chitinophaga terrae (ex Kim and Jung 2007)]SEA73347.1 branched-chain amino acid aminotransferase [Chitinophaga terrae (ex Kim and Jung 2007)]
MQAGFLCYNGRYIPAADPIFTADNRSFRYGDGFFETLKVYQGQVLLADLHFERLLATMHLLHFDIPPTFTKEFFVREIIDLCNKNNFLHLARVRFAVFRSDGGLYDPINNRPNYVIQCWELSRSVLELNTEGLVIDIFPDVQKTCDKLSTIKSNNCLPYVMAAMYAKEHRLNEAVLLNQYGRIADSTIANVFVVNKGRIFTPPITEGGVCGVMRKYILNNEFPFPIKEKTLTIADFEGANEIFLTNAIYGIRWVGRFRNSVYSNSVAAIMHEVLHENIL